MFLTHAKGTALRAQHQANFSSLIDEVFDERSGLGNSTFEPDAKVLSVNVFREFCVQNDRDTPLVLSSEFAHGQPARAGGGFPIYVTKIVPGMIVAQH